MILEINGQAITGIESFVELVGSLKPHQRVTLLAVDHKSGNAGAVQVTLR
jgi:S1-C subfamily serine protease